MYRYSNIFRLLQQCKKTYPKDRYILIRAFVTDTFVKTKEYEGRKLVGFSMEEMYAVVSDVGNYKCFVPFCKKSDITVQCKEYLKANLVIGFPPLHESYTSKVTMVEPRIVKAECTDGKLFNHLNTLWLFSPGLKNNPKTCLIDFSLSFEFKSILHSHLSNLFFNEIVRQMENAFLEEARKRNEELRSNIYDIMVVTTVDVFCEK